MRPSDEWYRKAWDDTWTAATDHEASGMQDAALRAGVLWNCGCGFTNSSDTENCLDCRTHKDEQ